MQAGPPRRTHKLWLDSETRGNGIPSDTFLSDLAVWSSIMSLYHGNIHALDNLVFFYNAIYATYIWWYLFTRYYADRLLHAFSLFSPFNYECTCLSRTLFTCKILHEVNEYINDIDPHPVSLSWDFERCYDFFHRLLGLCITKYMCIFVFMN